jgi:spore coat protein CotH
MRSPLFAFAALAALACACGGSDPAGVDGGGDDDVADPLAESAVVFDESVVRTYTLTLTPDDLEWLDDNALLEQYVPATVEVDGDAYPQAAVRYKGSYGTFNRCFDSNGERNDNCDKLSIKLSFNEYDPDGTYHGLRKLNLHAMLSDPSRMHDALGYRLFREAGLAASRTAYARVVLNGEDLGLYAAVENIDGRFTRSRFPDGGEGNLYKDVWPGSDDSDEDDFRDALVTNEDDAPSVDRIMRFESELEAAGDDGFMRTISSWTDVDQLVGYFAVARLIDHWDDVTAWYCFTPSGKCVNHNYSWYESTDGDRLWLIPWDLDHTFEEPSPLREQFGMPDWDETDADCDWIDLYSTQGRAPACDPLLRHIASDLWQPYLDASAALLAGPFAPEAIGARIDELEALLAEHIAVEPSLTVDEWQDGLEALRDAVDAKRAFIADKIDR